jgi:hypothetical protein
VGGGRARSPERGAAGASSLPPNDVAHLRTHLERLAGVGFVYRPLFLSASLEEVCGTPYTHTHPHP